MKIISAFILAMTLFGCSSCSKKTTGTAENKQTDTLSGQSSSAKTDPIQNTSRFIVSFYSIGEGAEGIQINAFEKFIADKSLKINKSILFEKTPWGREGEVDFCMLLSEFSGADQEKFIAEVKAVLASAKWVHFSENTPCREKRKRQ